MTSTQVIQIERHKRSFFGKIVKWTFILFHLLMIVWAISEMDEISTTYNQLPAGIEKASAVVAAGMDVAFICGIWMFGTLILGTFVLLTRGPKIITNVGHLQ